MSEKRISVKMGAKLKADVESLMLDDRERVLKKYVLNIIKSYTPVEKFMQLSVRKEDISYEDNKHITLELDEELDEKIEFALNILNRKRNEFINMVLTDYVIKKNTQG